MKNIDINEFKNAAENGRVEDFIDQNLSPDASARLRSILSDPSATEKLLATPEAQALMNKLTGKK